MTEFCHSGAVGYRIQYRRRAVIYLRRLGRDRREQVLIAIERLAESPEGHGLSIKKLAGRY